MNGTVQKHLATLVANHPELSVCVPDIERAFSLMESGFRRGGKLLIAGNGGSAADADHIAGELMKSFVLPRPVDSLAEKMQKIDPVRGSALAEKLQAGLPTVALTQHTALTTAYLNDVAGSAPYVFAQQLSVLGKPGDVFLAISTSGSSENILNAAVVAEALESPVIALTGESGGKLAGVADVAIRVPATETYRVQEYHLPVYHALCLMIEEAFFEQP